MYQNYDLYHPNEYEHLTNLFSIQNHDLSNLLQNLCSGPKCHLKALEILEKYPSSTHLLYKLYLMTYGMKDYEESWEILKKIDKMLPGNRIIKDRLSTIQIQIKQELLESTKIETELFNDPKLIKTPIKTNNYIKLEKLRAIKQETPPEFSNFIERSQIEITANFIKLKKKENFDFHLNQIKNMWGIQTGQVENIYSISHQATKKLIRRGIDFEIIYNDSEDKILKNMVNGERITRAVEIKHIIEDNLKVFERLENIILQKEEITLELIKELHLLFTSVARYTTDYLGNMELIRRGKFKLVPNYLITEDDWILIFAKPSQVENMLQTFLAEIKLLRSRKVNPFIIAAYVHINFILIHPFDDGNGRVARALTSIILMENGLFPFNVYDAIKEKYSELLDKALLENDFHPFVNFIIEQQWKLLEFLETADYDSYIKEKNSQS